MLPDDMVRWTVAVPPTIRSIITDASGALRHYYPNHQLPITALVHLSLEEGLSKAESRTHIINHSLPDTPPPDTAKDTWCLQVSQSHRSAITEHSARCRIPIHILFNAILLDGFISCLKKHATTEAAALKSENECPNPYSQHLAHSRPATALLERLTCDLPPRRPIKQ